MSAPSPPPPAGLCSRCRHVRVVASRRSSFVRCSRADTDVRYPRYPPLPVSRCPGFEPSPRPALDGSPA